MQARTRFWVLTFLIHFGMLAACQVSTPSSPAPSDEQQPSPGQTRADDDDLLPKSRRYNPLGEEPWTTGSEEDPRRYELVDFDHNPQGMLPDGRHYRVKKIDGRLINLVISSDDGDGELEAVAKRNKSFWFDQQGELKGASTCLGFSKEVERLRAAQGDGVVELLDYFKGVHEQEIILMPALTRELSHQTPFTHDLLLSLVSTLERLHTQGIIHTDIKPSNILLDAAGQPIFIDFSDSWGTSLYSEFPRGELGDVRALGVTLFEVRHGRRLTGHHLHAHYAAWEEDQLKRKRDALRSADPDEVIAEAKQLSGWFVPLDQYHMGMIIGALVDDYKASLRPVFWHSLREDFMNTADPYDALIMDMIHGKLAQASQVLDRLATLL